MRFISLLLIAAMLLCGVPALAEEESPSVPGADFALDLFGPLVSRDEKNIVVSPVSAYLALLLAAQGAEGETLAQFEGLLGMSKEEMTAAYATLMKAFAEDGGAKIANSAWVDERFAIREEYLEDLGESMQAEIFRQTLSTDTGRAAINDWIEDRTEGMLPDFLSRNLPEETGMALINAVYLKAQWRLPFDEDATQALDFTLESGEKVQADFLSSHGYEYYINSDGAEGVMLFYRDSKLAFVALRPTAGTLKEFASGLTAERLKACIDSAESRMMDLKMPKFEVEYSASLGDLLRDLGLTDAFDPDAADFSAMSEADQLYISGILQKVKVIVNEQGTEAAAATMIAYAAGAMLEPPEPIELTLDTPYLYAIVDVESGVPLFIGCMDDPSL